ncbi:MAG: hypothetical protein FIB01_06850 [Gemmatimonadetes bacterium]|nr:hypothetical protein [Gemmatimonadota bacterium]
MPTALLLLPAALSALLLGAHYLRSGHLLVVVLLLGVVVLLFVRRAWARTAVQLVLLLGTFEWLRTLYNLARLRSALGEPWLRMAIILGGVTLFTALPLQLLETRRAWAHFHARPPA